MLTLPPPGGSGTQSGPRPAFGRNHRMPNVIEIDQELLEQARHLRQRAESLRSQAGSLTPVLGTAYRRRASELEFEAWVSEAHALWGERGR